MSISFVSQEKPLAFCHAIDKEAMERTEHELSRLQHTLQQLGERVPTIEAVQAHMATKAEMIESRAEPRFSFGRRKRKNNETSYWINNDINFVNALIAVSVMTLIFTPKVITLVQALFARVF